MLGLCITESSTCIDAIQESRDVRLVEADTLGVGVEWQVICLIGSDWLHNAGAPLCDTQ